MRSFAMAVVLVAMVASQGSVEAQMAATRAPMQAKSQAPLFETCVSPSVAGANISKAPGLHVVLVSGNVQKQDRSATLTGTITVQQAICTNTWVESKLQPLYTLRDATVTVERVVTASTTIAAPVSGQASASTSANTGVKVGGKEVASTSFQAGASATPPAVTLEQSYTSVRGKGTLDMTIESAPQGTFTITDFTFEAQNGDNGRVRVTAGNLSLYGCVMRLAPSVAIDSEGFTTAGKLVCDRNELGNAKIKYSPLRSTTVTGELKLFGLPFSISLASDRDKLKGTGRWAGQSRDFVRLPTLPGLELRVTNPVATLAFSRKRTGANQITDDISASFDADKVELRTAARTPSNEPWLSAYIDPGPSTMSATGTQLALPTLAAVINDPLKAARDTCTAAAGKLANNPATKNDERADAINACNAANPAPPAVPSAPSSISIDVTIAVR